MRQIFLFFLFAVTSLAAGAAEVRYYDVEIVLFENLDPAARQSEVWPVEAEVLTPETYIELGLPYPGPMPKEFIPANTFKPLSDASYRLKQEVSILDKSDRYRLLMHLGWRQPGMPADESLAVHLERLLPPLETAGEETAAEDTIAAAGGGMDAELSQPAKANYLLNGFVRISLSRYLHVKADLVYRQEPPAESMALLDTPEPATENGFDYEEEPLAENLPPVFHLLQTRRMRSGELHYLDHPVLGMLILVTPVKQAGSPS